MKTRILSTLFLLAFAITAGAGQINPYLYTYEGSPVNAPVTSINPKPGATVIDIDTGIQYRKISAVGSNATYAVLPVTSVVTTTPLTGATITGNSTMADEYNVITPAGTIANLTYVFPSNANSRIGQEITLQSTQIVTTMTLTKGGQTITDPAGTALAANVPQRWIKTAASTWVRISNVATDSGVVLTGSVITDGLTASGSAANTFAGSTGTFVTSTGANTISGDTTVAAGKDLSFAAGDGKADFSLGTGVTKTTSGLTTITGGLNTVTQALSGAGAVNVTTTTTKLTSTGGAQALTLADGTDGQIKVIVHDVDGGSSVLTPTTKTGFTTITFTDVGESATLIFVTTRGWIILSLRGAVAA